MVNFCLEAIAFVVVALVYYGMQACKNTLVLSCIGLLDFIFRIQKLVGTIHVSYLAEMNLSLLTVRSLRFMIDKA